MLTLPNLLTLSLAANRRLGWFASAASAPSAPHPIGAPFVSTETICG